jgi:hypothetical protein
MQFTNVPNHILDIAIVASSPLRHYLNPKSEILRLRRNFKQSETTSSCNCAISTESRYSALNLTTVVGLRFHGPSNQGLSKE